MCVAFVVFLVAKSVFDTDTKSSCVEPASAPEWYRCIDNNVHDVSVFDFDRTWWIWGFGILLIFRAEYKLFESKK